jgi:prophage regulatory protein
MVSPNEQFLRLPDVERKVGLRKAAIYARIKEGAFPAPVKLFGGPAVAWRLTDLLTWMGQQGEA